MNFTPFYDKIATITERGPRFFVPGHKGCPAAVSPLLELARWDITEVAGACNLSDPAAELAESEANMARVYGAGATCYSAFGSSSCIMAMLALFCGAGEAVIMARGAHVSAGRAMALLNLTPHWVPLNNGAPCAQDIGAALARSGIKTVYITSVDYYGRIPDVAAIAEVCKKYGAHLLCDNAHGAHLRFFGSAAPRHPLALGASAVADSAHKTLPCLTPAALLHLADERLAKKAREALNLFSGTSPSYPVLLSLDLAAGRLLGAPPDFQAAAGRLNEAARPAEPLRVYCADPLRLVLRPAQGGRKAGAYHDALLGMGVAPEYYDGDVLVFMASPWNTEKDFSALECALAALARQPQDGREKLPGPKAGHRNDALLAVRPTVVSGVRDAFFGHKRRLPVEQAVNQVCAGMEVPCPPGVPLVLPGEMVGAETAEALRAGGILYMDVVK